MYEVIFKYEFNPKGTVMSDEKSLKLAEQVAIWKKTRQTFYANDILNMMIETGLIAKYEVDNILLEVKNKEVSSVLPTNYLE